LWILQGKEGESKQRIAEDLIDEKNFVLLADPECKRDAWDTGEFVRQVADSESEGGYKDHGAVRLTRYQLCKYAISNEQFQLFDGNFNREDQDDYERSGGANQPAVFVSWFDGYWFSEFVVMKGSSWQVVLPTEAQWEYGARAGSRGLYFRGLGGVEVTDKELKEYAHYDQDRGTGKTLAVRGHGKLPNAWGLEMMSGNVWEWCSDWWDDYPAGFATDPVGPEEGSSRVSRGGSCLYGAADCRSAFRGGLLPSRRFINYGFRVALSSIRNPQVAGGGQ
jgi:formylglycine-generating enzyme required for sulfatase activity